MSFLFDKNEGIYCSRKCAQESNAILSRLERVTEDQIYEDETNPEFWDVYTEDDGEIISTPYCGHCCSNCMAVLFD